MVQPLKITRFKTTLVDVPLVKPIATAIHRMSSVGCVLLELETDQGIVGESLVYTLNGVRLRALHEMLLGFSHQVEGRDAHYIAAIWRDSWNEMNPIGHKGFSIAALSAIDIACWDLLGRAAGLPLHQLFGACRDRIRTYASGGLWLSQSIDSLVEEAAGFVDAGFRALHKIHSHRRLRIVGTLEHATSADEQVLTLHHPVLSGKVEEIEEIVCAIKKIENHAEDIPA